MNVAEKYIKEARVRVDTRRFAVVKAKSPVADAWACIRDHQEITIIIEEGELNRVEALKTERGWRLLTFNVVMPFDVVGFLAAVSGALAKEGIPIFAISSYSTDHILVKDKDLGKAIGVLHKLGCGI